MIRRELKVSGQPDRWVLFRQPDHAVFAASIAEGWQSRRFTPLEPRDDLLVAIHRHDDGWRAWEENPQVDREHGRPIAFNEMPLAESVHIWRLSILEGQTRSPLQAYAIAGHFSSLLRGHDSWRKDARTREIGEAFLAWTDQQSADWLAQWCATSSANTPELAERAVAFVRLFDALSLWFLCAERTAPATLPTPAGPSLTITPTSPTEMLVEPWPFLTERYHLSASGSAVPAVHYRSAEELKAAPAKKIDLTWELQPRSSSG